MTDTPGGDPFVAQLAELCRAHPTRAKWVIVSSHAVGHTLGERVAREGRGWANLRFKTPFDLALEMAAPFLVARGIDPLGDELGPALMMRLLASLPENTSPYFKNLGAHHEMGAALWSSICELRLAGIAARDLAAAAFASAAKHAELHALMAAYESWLASTRRADRAAVYAEARRHLDAAPIAPSDLRLEQPDVVWPPLVRAFLDALPGERLVPAVPRIPGLALPRRLQNVPRDERETASPLALLMQPDRTGSLSRSDASNSTGGSEHTARGNSADSPRPNLCLFRAGGAEAEIEEVFRRILHAGNSPLPFDEVEIACASPDYPFLVWQKAQRYGWPVTVGPGLPIAATRPARALVAWCDWIEAGYPASGLRRMFRSGDIRVDAAGGPGAGLAARLLLRSGATWGRSTYARALAALALSERAEADNPETDPDRQRWLLARAAQAERLALWIDALLAPLPDPDSDTVPLQPLVRAARDFVARCSARNGELDEWGASAIDTALASLASLGDTICAPGYALDLIRAAISGIAVGADRARPGHLHVSMLARAGVAGRRYVFVVGLEEGRVFPAVIEDPVLLDAERTAISAALPTSLDRAAEAVHAVVSRLVVLAQPRGQITLSFSCRDLREYRETFPSWLMLQACRLLRPGAEVTYKELNAIVGEPCSAAPGSPGEALADAGWWLAALKEAYPPDAQPVLAAFPALALGVLAGDARASDRFTIYDGYVRKAGVVLDPRVSGRPISATTLERAAACPFRFFLERALGVEALEEEEPGEEEWLDPLTRGSLLHDLYADMMRELRRRGETADPARHTRWLHARADSRLNALADLAPPPSPEIFEHERQALHRDLALFLVFEKESAAHSTPVAFEVVFGGPLPEEGEPVEPLGRRDPIEVGLGDARFSLAGRIDRIDRIGPSRYQVTDYKTGSFYRPAYAGTFRGGRQLQHVLYALAADTLLEKLDAEARVVSGRYYFPSAKGGGEQKVIPRPAAARVAAVLTDLFDTIRAGAFAASEDGEACKFCEYGPACGAGGDSRDVCARAKAKFEASSNRMLDPFRRLRRHE